MLNYSSKSYWDERYKILNTRTYDWLEDYDNLRKFILNLNIPKDANILNVGSGTSELSEKLYDDGYTNNYNIDISIESLNIMRKRNIGKRPKIVYIPMNAKKMKNQNKDNIKNNNKIPLINNLTPYPQNESSIQETTETKKIKVFTKNNSFN